MNMKITFSSSFITSEIVNYSNENNISKTSTLNGLMQIYGPLPVSALTYMYLLCVLLDAIPLLSFLKILSCLTAVRAEEQLVFLFLFCGHTVQSPATAASSMQE
jgi:hypothetical protein